jgi:hypothetical protein
MSSSHSFIDGIFNYCDRWCERCDMTRHCRVFATQESVEAASKAELQNETFWRELDERLGLTVDETNEWLEEMLAVEPPTDEQMVEYEQEREWAARLIEGADLMQAADAYREAVDAWIGAHQALHEAGLPPLNEREMPSEMEREAVDAAAVASWYHFQIYVKLHRALNGKREDEWDDNRVQNDWNGSARVALLGLERSMTAWSILRDHFPDEHRGIVRLITHCGLIRRMLLEEFPDVREFLRPGFDDR